MSAINNSRVKGSFGAFDRIAKRGGRLNVVFLGGSITWGANASDPNQTSWRALMGKFLQEHYPKAHIRVHDAAIGGTGSDLGMFRLERDVLAHDPDLVFVEFTVNDNVATESVERLASYEEILRVLIGRGIAVQQVFLGTRHCFDQANKLEKFKRRTRHIQLSKAYHTAASDTFVPLRNLARHGKLDLDEMYPFEGTHPGDLGYRLFFELVRDGYLVAVKEQRQCVLPKQSIFKRMYPERCRRVLVEHELPRGWQRAKTYRVSLWFDGLPSRWMGDVAMADIKNRSKIKPLKVTFKGSMVALFGEANDKGLPFTVKIDGKPIPYRGRNYVWPFDIKRFKFNNGNLFKWQVIRQNLAQGTHELEIMPVFPKGVNQGQLHIESICSAGEI